MISVEEAQELIQKNIPSLCKEEVSTLDSLGAILAEDIYAPLSLPLTDNAAMDGFVVRTVDTRRARTDQPIFLRILGGIKAGDRRRRLLNPQTTYRIMTGAGIPAGGDAVIPKEEVLTKDDYLMIVRPLVKGSHVRREGEEVKKGDRVLKRYSPIHPGVIGTLASLGKSKVKIFRKPRVSLIATGSELVSPGRSLEKGQIYDSNLWMITSALRLMGHPLVFARTLSDRSDILRKTARNALVKSDVVILMGGVSVGDYDLVKPILREIGVRTIFWKVSQKPGKPLYFGRKRRKLIFGLPGNPASVFTCFYEYVYPALRRMSGFASPYLERKEISVGGAAKADSKKQLFLKARTSLNNKKGKAVAILLPHQGSHMVSSLACADSFIVIPPRGKGVEKGEKVIVDLLPYSRLLAGDEENRR